MDRASPRRARRRARCAAASTSGSDGAAVGRRGLERRDAALELGGAASRGVALGDQPLALALDLAQAQVGLVAARLVALHLALELGGALRVVVKPAPGAVELVARAC